MNRYTEDEIEISEDEMTENQSDESNKASEIEKQKKKSNMREILDRLHKEIKEYKFNCDLCGYGTNKPYNYTRHLESVAHNNVVLNDGKLQKKEYKCKEEGCKYSTTDCSNFNKHKKVHNPETKVHICPIIGCGYKSYKKSKVNKHYTTNHTVGYYMIEIAGVKGKLKKLTSMLKYDKKCDKVEVMKKIADLQKKLGELVTKYKSMKK